MKVTVRVGFGWPEVWVGELRLVPRVDDDIVIGEATYTVHRVLWGLPANGRKPEVVIYAK